MNTRRWYMPALIIVVAVIGTGAAFSLPSLHGWRSLNPFGHHTTRVTVASASHAASAPAPVRQQAVPSTAPPSTPAPAVSDAATVAPAHPATRPAPRWVPSDRQRLRDRVYLAGKANRPDSAIAALEAWDATHPGDPEVLRELARLLARSSRPADAFVRYRQLLAVTPASDTSVRAEYAGALLATQQYDSAAANYRLLTAADDNALAYHLGLARALAWGNHPREAEPELRWVAARMPGDTTVDRMLRLARGAYDPSADEAKTWVAGDPAYVPYRLALARAYVREQNAPLSLAHFDTVLAVDHDAPLFLVREAAGAHATAGDSIGNAKLLGRAVSIAPDNLPLRLSYAEALAWSGDRASAIPQYDTLLMNGRDPDLLMDRARLYAMTGSGSLAERDLLESAALRPTPAAYVALGDLYRWRGDRRDAREAYARANAMQTGDAAAMAGLEQIAAAERREWATLLSRDVGWRGFSSYIGDNAGFDLYTAGLGGGVALGDHTVVTLGADARRLDTINGRAADLGLVRHVGSFRFAGDGGLARYDGLGDFGYGSLSGSGPLHGAWLSVDLRTGPTFQWLMSASTLTYSGGSAALTVPAGRGALTGGVDQMWLSDGNSRTALQLGARYPLGLGVSAVYSGGMIGFDHASDLYWNPKRFTSHALGLEIASQRDSGLSVSARVLPGIGLAPQMFNSSTALNENAAQLSSAFVMDYRRHWWALGVNGEYARGVRERGYHAARAGVRLQITP